MLVALVIFSISGSILFCSSVYYCSSELMLSKGIFSEKCNAEEKMLFKGSDLAATWQWRHMAAKVLYKLDQETWLCRTQLDDFLVKIWTILDHTKTRLNLVVKAILWNLW